MEVGSRFLSRFPYYFLGWTFSVGCWFLVSGVLFCLSACVACIVGGLGMASLLDWSLPSIDPYMLNCGG